MRRSKLLVLPVLMAGGVSSAATLPPNFQESTVFSGLDRPTVVKFAPDGRVFVAEKSGIVKIFASLSATTPVVFADLRTNVHNFWDRGLLGLELDPAFPTRPYVYVLYTLDRAPGGTIPTWGTPGTTDDGCPTPPGPTSGGCAVAARLSRLEAAGDVMTGPELVLLEEWCQQFPSHSIGAMAFGPDGALYLSGGDGANFLSVDYGQFGGGGTPLNVCGDPPVPVGGLQTPPSAQGGALRSQSLRRPAGPAVFNGALLRVAPDTGQPLPDNPLIGSPDPKARRVVAYGLRNPFRLAVRPGTSEIWIGDVGWNTWEEIDRLPSPTAAVANFGWPCYEGSGRQPGYDGTDLDQCESLYSAGGVTAPYYAYPDSAKVVPGESCPIGSSSIAGLAFYESGSYPASYQGALFFTDYSRKCIWAMRQGVGGLPNPADRLTFADGLAGGAVHLEIGPGGDLFYSDYDQGRIQRIRYFSGNQPPTAVAAANPTSGPEPLMVQFDGSASSDPDLGDTLTYAWDLDGDGAFDDSTVVSPSFLYTTPGNRTVRLRVTDSAGASGVDSVTISVGNQPPTAAILSPLPSLTWKVGDTISFWGAATDPQQGTLPPSALTWTLILQHCPSNCHQHIVQTFPGVAGGSFSAPDHAYPSYLELRLTATDALGLQDTKSVSLFPQTVDLSFDSSPAGMQLAVDAASAAAPFTRTVIVGSVHSLSAPSPQTLGGLEYGFASWSDGGARTHTIVAGAVPTTYRADFRILGFQTLTPCRLVDTRGANGPRGGPALPAGSSRTFALRGHCGIPAEARALAVNVAVTGPTAPGHLKLYATGSTVPPTSVVNYGAGQTRGNNAIVALNGAGELDVRCGQGSGTTDFILDVSGYFE